MTKNRFTGTIGATTATVEANTSMVLGVDSPTNRSTSVPNGAILRSVLVNIYPQTMTAGKHRALLWRRPAAEDLSEPIVSYFNAADPLSEDGINMRKYAMGRVQTYFNDATSMVRPFHLRWKGAMRIREGDEVMATILDTSTATTYTYEAWTSFTE